MASTTLINFTLVILFLNQSLSWAKPSEDRRISFIGINSSDIWDKCYEDLKKRIAYCRNRQLQTVPDYLSRHVQELDLSQNSITALFDNSFKRYGYLTKVNLLQNNVSMIEPKAFYPLIKLTVLILDDNPLGDLGTGEIFRYSYHLQTLYLESCQIRSLPSDFLYWIPGLVNLYLTDNNLECISLTSCSRENLNIDLNRNRLTILSNDTFFIPCQSVYINLEMNPFQKIDPRFIESLSTSKLFIGDEHMTPDMISLVFAGIVRSSIEELRIRFVNLANITDEFFEVFDNFHLDILELSFAQFEFLYPSMFTKLNDIDELLISANLIEVIEPEYFEGMHKLKILRLDWNKITSVNPNHTPWKLGLNALYLIGNKLTYIDSSSFIGLSNLTHLDLSFNPLVSLEIRYFGINNLKTLDVSATSLLEISLYHPNLKSFVFEMGKSYYTDVFMPGETFENTQSLEIINLMSSRLRVKDIWYDPWGASLFDGLFKLEVLHLSWNEIFYLPSSVFEGLRSLEILNIEGSEIKYIETGVFTGLLKLHTLNLRDNYLVKLPSGILSDLKQLQSFDIGGNRLTFLEDDLFTNTTLLRNLVLFKNQFTTLNHTTFDPIKLKVDSIDLSQNPFNCTCQLTWLVDWLMSSVEILNGDETICDTSEWDSLLKMPLTTFHTNELCGESFISHDIPLLCLGALVIMVMYITVLMGYRNRWLLKYRFFLLKTAMLRHGENHEPHDRLDFEFDLNVIFFDDDEEWVREQLRPAMEERLPSFDRNVFGGEDLPLGMHYMDATHYVIENSFKTILLLSRAAVRDNWFLIKFRATVDYDDNNAGDKNMVVVFLDNIPDEELPYVVRLYLSDNRPYLKWVEDATGQEYFWIELTKYLTINLKEPDVILPE